MHFRTRFKVQPEHATTEKEISRSVLLSDETELILLREVIQENTEEKRGNIRP
jgi:hypothetical protein